MFRAVKTGTSDSHSPECVIPYDVLIQFGPPDDEHLQLETCRGINKYIKKECIKLVITQHCIEMHGQQNIKFRIFIRVSNRIFLEFFVRVSVCSRIKPFDFRGSTVFEIFELL
jgi:hypothetical protein